MTENKIAAIWARISTKEQQTLEAQVAEVKPWLESQGYVVPPERILMVDWTSTAILDCPEMQRLLEWVRKGEIGAIGMVHGDRISALPEHKLHILWLCRDKGVEVLAKNSPILPGDEGMLVEHALTLGKKAQVVRAREGSRWGLNTRAREKHLPPTMAKPYGMRWKSMVMN